LSSSITRAVDVLIIGASAAGLMCAIEAGKRQRKVLVIDHANKAGKKILMSGGGRCNFTNYQVGAHNFLSHNPHFCKSALSRFTQWDFISMVERHGIPYHEREHGQLFCNDSAKDILNMLLEECQRAGVRVQLDTPVGEIKKNSDGRFQVNTENRLQPAITDCQSRVVASGGLSIPKMCASPIGYRIAEQFGINVRATRAGLVPFTLHEADKQRFAGLAGIAVESVVANNRAQFRENILFTHRGLSGPAILQISSYWQPGECVTINLLPDKNVAELLSVARQTEASKKLKTILTQWLPKRLVAALIDDALLENPLQHLNQEQIQLVSSAIHQWALRPNGTEGYRTAEVTLGGVDCDALSSKTMECQNVAGLYFIGEVLDVTGWLGGYNFQWAWSSGWCAGQYA
jgi:predicted Rossmann fold flavoprotein